MSLFSVITAVLVAASATSTPSSPQTPQRREPVAISTGWGHPTKVDDQGRIVGYAAPQELWGVRLPSGMTCRSEKPDRSNVPCEALSLPKIREVLLAHGGPWRSIMTAQRGPSYLFTEVAEYLVAQGWLLDQPSISNGYYAPEMQQAKLARRGIWKVAVSAPPPATRFSQPAAINDSTSVGVAVTHRAAPVPKSIIWGKPDEIDAEGHVRIAGKSFALWGATLSVRATCTLKDGSRRPCSATWPTLAADLKGHFGKWGVIQASESGPPLLFTDMTERLVAEGAFVDQPDISKGYYATDQEAASSPSRYDRPVHVKSDAVERVPQTDDEKKAAHAAEAYVEDAYRMYNFEPKAATIVDHGDHWDVIIQYNEKFSINDGIYRVEVAKTSFRVRRTSAWN